MLKNILLIILVSQTISVFAQFDEFEDNNNQTKPPFKLTDKLFYGGNFGMQFGKVTLLELSPQIGYYVNDYVGIGISATGMYYRNKLSNPLISDFIYGGSIFSQLYIMKFLIIHAEAQALNGKYYPPTLNYAVRVWDYAFLVGGGYRQKIGKKGAINTMVLWNFNETETSFYTNPIFKITVVF